MIPIPGLSKVWAYVVAAGAAIALVLGILFMGRSWGKSSEKAKSLKAQVKGQKAALKTAQDATEMQAKAAKSVADVATKRHEEKAAVKAKGPGRTLGKWCVLALFLPFFLLAMAGCGSHQVEVIRPPIMELEKIPRPELHEVYIEPGMCLNHEQVDMIFDNEFSLVTTVKQYEALIEAHQEFVRLYKAGEVDGE